MSMRKVLARWSLVALAFAVMSSGFATTALAERAESPGQPDFGPNVHIFNSSMPQSDIQATVDAIAAQQVSNQFGTQRYALLFEPGTYGSATAPLNFQVGYYTAVAGLWRPPHHGCLQRSLYVHTQVLCATNLPPP